MSDTNEAPETVVYVVCPYCGEKSDEAGRIIHGDPCRTGTGEEPK